VLRATLSTVLATNSLTSGQLGALYDERRMYFPRQTFLRSLRSPAVYVIAERKRDRENRETRTGVLRA